MREIIFFIFVGFSLSSCTSIQKKQQTYFGGEILNPKSEFVLLMKTDQTIDTITLSEDSSFDYYFDLDTSGLYAFKHGNEFQYVYFEPLDSIRIRLNTWDFDESLVFDGKGAEKSDFLQTIFLNNEQETSNLRAYFKLNEEAFEKKFNESLSRNLSKFEVFAKTYPDLSQDYLHLARAASTFPIYRMKEIYPFTHDRQSKYHDSIALTDNFYKFRKDINLNDSILVNYYAYQNYISAYIFNDAYVKSKYSKTLDDNFNSLIFESILENISYKPIKNSLLYQEIINLIFNTESAVNPEFLDFFFSNCTDNVMVERVKESIRLKHSLKDYNLISNLKFKNKDKQKYLTLDNIINNRPTLLVFWNDDNWSKEALNKRIDFLAHKFPDIQILQIEQVTGKTKVIYQSTVVKDFQLIDKEAIKPYIKEDFPRSLIFSEKREIVNNFPIVFSSKTDDMLQELVR